MSNFRFSSGSNASSPAKSRGRWITLKPGEKFTFSGIVPAPSPAEEPSVRFLGRAVPRAILERGWRTLRRLDQSLTLRKYLNCSVRQEENCARAFPVAGPPVFDADGDLIGHEWPARQVSVKGFKLSLVSALYDHRRDQRNAIVRVREDGSRIDLNKAHTRREQSDLSSRSARTARGLEAFRARGWQTGALTFTLESAWHRRPFEDQLDEIGKRLTKLSDSMRKAGHPFERMAGLGTHLKFFSSHVHLATAVRTIDGVGVLLHHSRRLFPAAHGVHYVPIWDAEGWGHYIQQDAVLPKSVDRGLCSIAGSRQFRVSRGWPSLESLRAGRPDGALALAPPNYLSISPPSLAELMGWVNSRLSRKYDQERHAGISPRFLASSCLVVLPPATSWHRVSARPGPATSDFARPQARAPPSSRWGWGWRYAETAPAPEAVARN